MLARLALTTGEPAGIGPDLALLRTVGETLAGRATCFTLHPMTRRELLGDAACGLWSVFRHGLRPPRSHCGWKWAYRPSVQ